MEDKDRLGDKLHEKGKGDEDNYFARQDRERLERLRQARIEASGRGLCPKDRTPLTQWSGHGVTADSCPTCGGVWLDKGELETMLRNETEPGATRWVRSILER